MLQIMLIFITILLLPPSTYGIIGFDRGEQHMNITSVSLLGVNDCDLTYRTSNHSNVYIQLLQLSEYNHTEIIQCKVEVSRKIQYCGMHSHTSTVNNARMEYFLEVRHSKCLRMFQDGTLTGLCRIHQRAQIKFHCSQHYVSRNRTKRRQLSRNSVLGSLWNLGQRHRRCHNPNHFKIILRPSTSKFWKNILKSGTVCTLSDGFCIDSEDGYTFWKPMPSSSCSFHQYDVLYEGPATEIHQTPLFHLHQRFTPSPRRILHSL